MKPHSSQIQPPGLYVVATPIGNLQDITLRALDLLKRVDLVACEDTRVTQTLLSAYGIKVPLVSYHDHSDDSREREIMAALASAKRVALVSDAGTPLISDPGYRLVRAAHAAGIYVTAIPGASSVLMALCLSGLPSDRFFFAGFLSTKKEALKKDIAELAAVPSTLVFFESARRLADTLPLLLEGLGNREACIARELTKLYEETRRGSLSELTAHYAQSGDPKGEVVIVVAPPSQAASTDAEVSAQLATLLAHMSVKDAAQAVAVATGRARKDVYALALALTGRR